MVNDTGPDPAKVIWQLDNVNLLEVLLFHPVVIFPMKTLPFFPHLPFDKLVMLGGELEGVRVKTKCFLTKLFLHCSEILPQAIFPDNVKFVSRAAMCLIYLQLCAMALILIPVLNVFFLFGTCPYSWRFIYTHYNINNIFHYLRKKLFLHQHIRSSTYPYPLPPVKLNNSSVLVIGINFETPKEPSEHILEISTVV